MAEAKCPLCGSLSFYVRDREDEYEIHEFDLMGGKIVSRGEAGTALPEAEGETETYCCKCAWHGKLRSLGRNG